MKYPYQTLNSDISKDVKDLILYSIKNPLTFILRDDKDGLTDDTFSGNWIYGAYKGTSALDASNKLWGSDFVDKSGNLALNATFSGKTIYDPCPVGWCIPPQDTWTNFTKNTPEQWNNYNIAGTTGSGTFIKYYNCPVEDQKNWTDGDGMGFMKAPVFGRRFYIRGEGGDVAFTRQKVVVLGKMELQALLEVVVTLGHRHLLMQRHRMVDILLQIFLGCIRWDIQPDHTQYLSVVLKKHLCK